MSLHDWDELHNVQKSDTFPTDTFYLLHYMGIYFETGIIIYFKKTTIPKNNIVKNCLYNK